jgi:hypothetical protein
LFITVPIINNIVAEGIVRDLESLPLPEQTEIWDSVSAAGNLASEELEAHYSQINDLHFICLTNQLRLKIFS